MILIDCHVHLQEEVMEPVLDEVLLRARQGGVRRFVCHGTHEGDWERVLQLSRDSADIVPCFGLHPWYVNDRSDRWLSRLEVCLDAVPSAIGEIGLDSWVEDRDEAAQEEVFRAQLHLAIQRGLPVMVHCVRAWGWLMDVLREVTTPAAGVLLHAYSGPADLVEPLTEMGAYFSFGGTVLKPGNTRLRAALLTVPPDRLLVEIDAPALLPPETHRPFSFQDAEGSVMHEPAALPVVQHGGRRLLKPRQAD
ncbi:MAG: TatD family hydrolase [Armatimonadetes bacterium]|nr:TatD family hydrolase [Armatimonadota bacterium]